MADLPFIQPDFGWVAGVLPVRRPDAHKGAFGVLGVLAGCRRYRGAAALCCHGAARAGVGLVRLASTETVCAAAAAQLPGCVFLPLAESADGGIAPGAGRLLAETRPHAAVAGCGMDNTADTAAVVKELLDAAACPLVLDADALNVMAGRIQNFLPANVPVILTPHLGELARLAKGGQANTASLSSLNSRAKAARAIAERYGCVVVAKAHRTVTVTPNGAMYLNGAAGNAGMAKGGSGDVLAGVIGALLAQGLPPEQAAAAGVWLHAAAGDAAAAHLGMASMLPADIPLFLAGVLKRFEISQKITDKT